MTLTGKQRRYLRGLGHHLEPVVRVGKEGVTDGLAGALDKALADHELIKIKLEENAGPGNERDELGAALAKAGHAELVQVLGRTVLLYRERPEDDTEGARKKAATSRAPKPRAAKIRLPAPSKE